MSYVATEDIDDALAATRAFLLPVEVGRWLRLAVVALFVAGAGGTNAPSLQYAASGGTATDAPPVGQVVPVDLPVDLRVVLVALAAVALVVGLAFALVAAVMEFVLVESLRAESVSLRTYARARLGQALQLFGFQLLVGLGVTVVAGGLVAVALWPALAADAPVLSVAALVLVVPFVLVVVLAALAVNWLTTAFVVPTMIADERGLLDGWRRFWPVLRAAPVEYLAVGLVYAAIVVVAGIAVSIGTVVGAAVLAVPFGLLGALALALAGAVPAVGFALLSVVVVAYVLSVLAVLALLEVPLVTYLRYYVLLVLGDTDADLDLVAERRAAIRGTG